MTPSDQLRVASATLEGLHNGLSLFNMAPASLRNVAEELLDVASALDAVQPIVATTTIQSSYAVATADLDLVSDALIELGDSAITLTRRMELVRAIRSLLKIS